MSAHEYCEVYEDAHYAVLERLERAKRKHPEKLTPLERFKSVQSELNEVCAELMRGDYEKAMNEYRDVGATLYRAMEELRRDKGVRIR